LLLLLSAPAEGSGVPAGRACTLTATVAALREFALSEFNPPRTLRRVAGLDAALDALMDAYDAKRRIVKANKPD
jgi:hypothetical protein